MGVPQNRWFLMENTIYKWMIWGYPYFRKPPYVQICSFQLKSAFKLIWDLTKNGILKLPRIRSLVALIQSFITQLSTQEFASTVDTRNSPKHCTKLVDSDIQIDPQMGLSENMLAQKIRRVGIVVFPIFHGPWS